MADLTDFSDEDLLSLYKQQQRGVRRQGYDDSADVTVDYDPTAQDAIDAQKIVTSDWEGGKWDDVRDRVRPTTNEGDMIHRMRGAVADEFLSRQDARFDSLGTGSGTQDEPETKEPFDPVDQSDDHKAAEDALEGPPGTTSAVDSYTSAFDRAVKAGRQMSAGDYLRQRADDKKGGINRFTSYLRDSNTLAAHEANRAGLNAIKRAGYETLKPPTLNDPGDMYDKYKGDIDSI